MPAHFCEKCGRPKAVVGIMDKQTSFTRFKDGDVFEIINGQIWACLKCNRKAIIDEVKRKGGTDDAI